MDMSHIRLIALSFGAPETVPVGNKLAITVIGDNFA